jgi:preflagellin peptidase FlaK
LLEAARTTLSLLFLFYSSWSDYRTREVSNTVWIVFAPLAFVLTFVQVYVYEPSWLVFYGVSFGLTAVFSIVLFYAGGFGGADAKALMCLALALPFYPSNLIPSGLFASVVGENSPITLVLFPVTVFSNAVLFAAATAVYIFFRNVFWRLRTGMKLFEGGQEKESFGKKALVLLTGYKMSIGKVKEKWHLYPLEDVEETSTGEFIRKLVVVPKDETREAMLQRLDKAVKTEAIQDSIIATPGLPMLIFVTAGLVMALLLGDVVWICVRLFLA